MIGPPDERTRDFEETAEDRARGDRPDVVSEVADELDVNPYLGFPEKDNYEVIIHALRSQADSEYRYANVMEEQLGRVEDPDEEFVDKIEEFINEAKRKSARYLYIAQHMEDDLDDGS